MATADDYRYMARAIELARRGLYTTHPNPRVGCVLVKNGQMIGEGYHRRAGELHAERNAIADAGGSAEGATAYVTLEPCCHHGRTPPCTEGLIEAGVARVVMAMQDPNPLVAGEGARRLRDAGIEVESGVLESQVRELNPGFIRRMDSGIPYVRCKLAMSLDGRTAMNSGESKWITGPAARADVQRLRARSDAIVTGIGTVLADDPSMNVRLEMGESNEPAQPLRVVLDPMLEMPSTAKMLKLPGRTLVICSCEPQARGKALAEAGAEVVMLPGSSDGIELRQLLQHLAERQINEVLVEAGSTLAGAALWQGLVDELVVYAAPHIMGNGGRGLFHLPELELMQDRVELEISDVRMVGRDMRMTIKPKR
ncbi:bifunctional diaminohydroxyphosphoribosylaminopyrimidine deaminase/5-amino-6-(5-phosphoribosylamino)uracil reductase RibD [Solemya velesiana gill symbiont]|uniref:Riboflavin biosynthesis protein RibD n=1 Tax=Solemya velesiana gill symbiont TaxID=1918948 RepID=A0A1T2KVH8_9GAMM|nr:bifunctional diaminohydroxyphosphoribosylaminopyrimidine deaminase/5-amino-6-(5-phosphoribosylamino)uracil reductase RibD [Solemya velesiana gill symbiont]OOZ36822.1 riboflavin biosynthesis protein RibD [Solemya velesiana gill symbiont]